MGKPQYNSECQWTLRQPSGMETLTACGIFIIEDPSRGNELIRWGENDCTLTHPLHYVSDMLFDGTLQKGKELPLVEALIQAGANLDFQRNREDGKKSDTPLIGAAS